jgi:FtsZ-interacting cell division protein ZipA
MSTFILGSLFDEGLPGDARMSTAMKERLIVLGAVMVVTLMVLGWAILFRRKRRRAARRADRHHRRQSFTKNSSQGMAETNKSVAEHRRRRHHRPRNPTLAETGGLPPVREDTPSS